MATKLKSIKLIGDEVEFERTDGNKTYYIKAYWDKSCSSWFQYGAPKDILSENVQAVQNFFYKRMTFDIKGMVSEARSNH